MHTFAIDYRSPRAIWITIGFILMVVVIGGLIGVSAIPDAWYETLRKAPWNPPNWVFGPAWFTLYVLIGIAGARSFTRGPATASSMVWAVQMLLNWSWSPIWFRLHAIWPAFGVIVSIFALIVAFIAMNWRTDRTAAWLFVPYGLWVAFASSLNLSVALLN